MSEEMINIVRQLVEIYKDEPWHNPRMSDTVAFAYHLNRFQNGDIVVYKEDDKVLGYYERYYIGDTCFLHNVYIVKECRRGKVFKWLHNHFMSTLREGTEYIVGTKQKIGAKTQKVKLRSLYGEYED